MGYGIGLDVCKAWIDAHVHGMERRARFPNTDTGLEALRHWLAEVPVRQCVLEATGGYEQQALDARIAQQVAEQPGLAVLGQIKGVGPVLRSALATQLPELGHLSGKAIAKLVGVAPLACDSGNLRGARRIWGGRAGLRATLYMGTLTAVRYEPTLRSFYQSLRDRGKPAKVALVASMRKLLVILNARMRDHLNASCCA